MSFENAIVDTERFPPDASALPEPALWNPGPAASWSLLLSPAFGQVLHAINWHRLGFPAKARANFICVGLTILFLTANLLTVIFPLTHGIDRAMTFVSLGWLIGWYFALGRSQIDYVSNELKDRYVKRGWGIPLSIGIVAFLGYLGSAIALAFVFDTTSPEDVAAELKPMILNEWKKNPDIKTASIRSITLKQTKEKTFEGNVDAVVNGIPQQLPIDAAIDGQMLTWIIQPNLGP